MQLHEERARGNVFNGFSEGEITFRPTYKFDPGTDNWDSRCVAERSLAAIPPVLATHPLVILFFLWLLIATCNTTCTCYPFSCDSFLSLVINCNLYMYSLQVSALAHALPLPSLHCYTWHTVHCAQSTAHDTHCTRRTVHPAPSRPHCIVPCCCCVRVTSWFSVRDMCCCFKSLFSR